MAKQRWVPLKLATHFVEREDVKLVRAGVSQASLDAEADMDTTYWINDLYQVARHVLPGHIIWLNIRRRDGKTIFRDWRHFQRIKNELVGEECEGVELYPAESRLADTSNKYHIWCFADPRMRFPFGFDSRQVDDHRKTPSPGLKQRKLWVE